jgi:hypothetical protein
MKSQLKDSLSNIRDAWTEEERRERKELARVMQLQLQALVVLSELSQPWSERENGASSVASAC